MPVWERNMFIIGGAVIVSGIFYFTMIARETLALGRIAEPSLILFLSYLGLQFGLGFGGIWLFAKADDSFEEDERDQLIELKAGSMAGHLYSFVVIISLLTWFVHGNASLLFHTLVLGMAGAEFGRCMFQVFNYHRSI